MTPAKPPRTSAARPADVGIVTVSYNSSKQVATFLPGAVASLRTPSHVVVADNDSADVGDTQRLATGWGARVVRLDRNAGYGAAANDSAASTFARFFTGNPTDRSMWLLIGGAVAAVVGIAGLIRGVRP